MPIAILVFPRCGRVWANISILAASCIMLCSVPVVPCQLVLDALSVFGYCQYIQQCGGIREVYESGTCGCHPMSSMVGVLWYVVLS